MFFPIRTILFLVVFVGGGTALQVWLSKMQSRFFGLILPTMFFLWSLFNLGMVAIFDAMTAQEIALTLLSVFFTLNIPTIFLLAIYAICRHQMAERAQKQSEMKKMNTMDLE